MKVLNYTTTYLAIFLLLILSLWAAIFYYAMLDEIYDSIDDGLDNRKGLILQKALVDPTILKKSGFDETDYSITPIDEVTAKSIHELYLDTMMYMQNEQDYEPVRLLRTAFKHNDQYYRMQVVTSMVEEDDLVSELLYALIWLYAGLITTILVLNNYLLKRIWRPFYHLLKQLKTFRLEKPSIVMRPTKIEEFRLLNEAVQKMLQSNIDVYSSQKQFIENASHEMQTPLAISINKLEALSEHQLNEEGSILLGSALDNLERLTRLNRSLLLLSKIENKQFVSTENININELVKNILKDFSDQLDFSQITVTVNEEGECNIIMNSDLASVLISNLIKNSIVHNHTAGTIEIIITPSSLEIINSGNKKALDPKSLFTRFNKEVVSGQSTGLGLAIAKAITGLFSFSIAYQFDGRHHMILSFPS